MVPKNSTTPGTQVKNTVGTEATGDDTDVADGGHINIGTVVYYKADVSGNTTGAGGNITFF